MLDVVVKPEEEQEQESSPCESQKPELNVNYSDIASKLLQDRFLLTALELYCELAESGKDTTKLKEFFSNPGNFEQNSRIEISPTGLSKEAFSLITTYFLE